VHLLVDVLIMSSQSFTHSALIAHVFHELKDRHICFNALQSIYVYLQSV